MADLFTTDAQAVLLHARQEARRLKLKYIGAEHLLLGLFMQESGVAGQVLNELLLSYSPRIKIDLDRFRSEVARHSDRGFYTLTFNTVKFGTLLLSRGASAVMDMAVGETEQMDHTEVGTEHLLLALANQQDGPAMAVLRAFGVQTGAIRGRVFSMLGIEPLPEVREPRRPASAAPPSLENLEIDPPRQNRSAKLTALWARLNLLDQETVRSEHVLILSILEEEYLAAKLLRRHGLDLHSVRAEAQRLRTESPESP